MNNIMILILIIIIVIIITLLIQSYCKYNKKTLIELLHPSWYINPIKFPYNDFKCEINQEEYNKIVNKGYDNMKNIRVIFCGLCINIEDKVEILEKKFVHLGSFFKDYKVVIFENNSIDNSHKLLNKLTLNNNKFILLDDDINTHSDSKKVKAIEHGIFSKKRMMKMANYRNKLLNYIKTNCNDFDVICMIDLDITGPINIDGVAHSFGLYNNWDAVSANGISGLTITLGKPFYYDLIAYKDDNYDINDNIIDTIPIYCKMKNQKIGNDLIKVQSAFAGMEFIKMDVINKGVNYIPNDNNYTCEHIIFHENMIKNNFDNIYINPNMVVLVGQQGNSNYIWVW